MSVLSRHPALRWAAPLAVGAVAVGATLALSRGAASAASPLPPRSAAQLLVDLQTASALTGSGTIVQKADLGLPQLPTPNGAGSSQLSSLVSGNHTLRVWYDGPEKARLALLGTLGESDVVRNGRDLWIWSSDGNSATHRVVPVGPGDTTEEFRKLTEQGLTPQQVADQALAAITPTTSVTTDGTARVAGRNAYELVLAPKDAGSLVGQVRIAMDADRHVPLRVQVLAKKATTPAIEVGFTRISFARPAASQFRFAPPPGAKITEESGSVPRGAAARAHGVKPTVTGKGWTSVLTSTLPVGDKKAEAPGGLGTALTALPKVSGSWGSGRVLRSHLFTVLLTDDGRVFAGAVPAERLYAAAAR
jgi:outer membrane lipoprotein-sorting protein